MNKGIYKEANSSVWNDPHPEMKDLKPVVGAVLLTS